MRRTIVALMGLVVALSAGSSSAEPVRVERNAFALWRVGRLGPDASKIVGVAVWTSRSPDQPGEIARFAVHEGICFDGAEDESCLISSDGYFSGKAKPGEVTIDPALGSARLKVTRRGVTTDVTWDALDEVEPMAGQASCGESEGGPMALAQRRSIATGRVMGRRVPKDPELQAADIVLGARVCMGNPAELAALLSDGRLEVRF
jgi:hypothetical protein